MRKLFFVIAVAFISMTAISCSQKAAQVEAPAQDTTEVVADTVTVTDTVVVDTVK